MDRRKIVVSGIIAVLLLSGVIVCQETFTATDTFSSDETAGTTPPPAVMKSAPQIVTVQTGQPVTLSCDIENADSGIPMWKKSGRALTSAHRKFPSNKSGNLHLDISTDGRFYNLQIKKASVDDKGEYTCTVEQDDPVSVTHTIVVTFPPTVDVRPKELSDLAQGDAFSLGCIASGHPVPQITWTMKGENGQQRELPQFSGMHNITVESLSRADAGEYQCMASNGVGDPVTSQPVKLVITSVIRQAAVATTDAPSSQAADGPTPAPAVIRTAPQILTVQAGQPLTLSCEIERPGSGVPMWKKGGRVLTSAQRKFINKNSRNLHLDATDEGRYNLQIKKVRIDDKGEYTCTVEQDHPVNVTHTVIVTYPPSADVQPTELSELEKGKAFSVTCIARGMPEPQIKWTLKDDNGHIRDLPQYDGLHNITVESLKRADAGDYQCVASNGVGDPIFSPALMIVITYPPELTSSQALFLTTKGHNATMRCSFSAYPTENVTARWYRNDVEDDDEQRTELLTDSRHVIQMDATRSSTGTSLLIISVEDEDLKRYVCSVDNGHGVAEHKMHLSAYPHPELMRLDDRAPHKLGVKMRVKSHSPVRNYKISYREVNQTHMGQERSELVATEKDDVRHGDDGVYIYERVHFIQGLRPAANYSVTMTAENEYGWSRETDIQRFSVLLPSTSAENATTVT